jgi:quercetin 2,3-dioxygenase
MRSGKLTRRSTLRGLGLGLAGASVAPLLWLPGCHGKSSGGPAQGPVPSRGSEASILHHIVARATRDGRDATLARVFPSPQLPHLDPFVLLDDFDVHVPAGFPEHPHRGFEAFTYMIDGAFVHTDSMGNESSIGPGGIQRFNSGAGARHSEMPGTPGSNRGVQLWVNLPRAKKQMAPEYQGVQGDAMPVDEREGQRVRAIVGPSSPAALHTEVEYLDVTLLADGSFDRVIPPGYSTLLYVIDGMVHVGERPLPRGHALVLGEGELRARGKQGARLVWLRGRPHDEPIVHRGPFVD